MKQRDGDVATDRGLGCCFVSLPRTQHQRASMKKKAIVEESGLSESEPGSEISPSMTVARAASTNPRSARYPSKHDPDDGLSAFVDLRPRLLHIAYRVLGTVAEAEDIV